MKMKTLLTFLVAFSFSACSSSTNEGGKVSVFLGSDKKEITIGYIKTLGKSKTIDVLSSGKDFGQDNEADLAFNDAIAYLNKSASFPFKVKSKILTFNSIDDEGIAKGIAKFKKEANTVTAWVGTKVQPINVALSEASIQTRVPIFFPISSKSLMTEGYPNLYQLTPSNTVFGYSVLDIAKFLNVKSIIELRDTSEFYSSEWSQAFDDINKMNGYPVKVLDTILGRWAVDDVAEIKERLRVSLTSHNFDGIFFAGRQQDVDQLLSVLDSLNIRTNVIVGDEGAYSTVFKSNKGLNKVYFPGFYPTVLKPENNPKTQDAIQAYYKFYNGANINNLASAQHYFSTPIVIAEIVAKVLSEHQDITNSDMFYDLFNNTAKEHPWYALMDNPPFRFSTNGSMIVGRGELKISENSKRDGVVTIGDI